MGDRSFYHEVINVTAYFIVLLILAYWLKDFFRMAWEDGFIRIIVPYYAMSLVVAIIIGIYYGILSVTLIKDDFKRIQSIFLLLFSICVTYFYLHHIFNYLFYFIVFFILASYYAYSFYKENAPTCRFNPNHGNFWKRPLAVVAYITIFFMIISIINYFIGYYYTFTQFPDGTMNSLLFTGFFIFVFSKFMNYQIDQSDIFVFGPTRIGKTAFIVALFDKTRGYPNDQLNDVWNIMINNNWPPANLMDNELSFSFPKGLLFRKCIKISTLDHPGGFIHEIEKSFRLLSRLEFIPEYESSNFKEFIYKIEDLPSMLSKEGIQGVDRAMKVIKLIAKSKKLIFLISALSISGIDNTMKEGMLSGKLQDYISTYRLIAQVTGKPFIFVVNKVDLEYAERLYYFFNWDKIPGRDNGRLIEFLDLNFDINWVNGAKIKKVDGNKTVKVSDGNNILLLEINDKNTKVKLKINDVEKDEFNVIKENSRLNICLRPNSQLQEEVNPLNKVPPLDEVAGWILKDLNTDRIFNYGAVKRSNDRDESSFIFPCWIKEDNGGPITRNNNIMAVGYEQVINRL